MDKWIDEQVGGGQMDGGTSPLPNTVTAVWGRAIYR